MSQKNAPNILRQTFQLTEIKTVLSRTQEAVAWDNWGVRDIAILTDEDGNFLRENSSLVAFYTGSTNGGELQQTGRVFSHDNGKTWVKDKTNPTLSISDGYWDSKVAATPWVIKKDSTYFMYYRGSTEASKKDAVGVATSKDGEIFTKYKNNPIITSKHFRGIRNFPSSIGVMNSVTNYEGEILLLFEANESRFDNRGQIFGARSINGLDFIPMNSGDPIFSSRNVSKWPVCGVCNPRLTKIGEGWYMLSFNGTQKGEYSIGVAFTRDFDTWLEHPSNPILVPRGWPVFSDFTHRLEGACFDANSISSMKPNIDCFFMAIPLGAKNHQHSIIGKATFKLTEDKTTLKIHRLPVNNSSVGIDRETIFLSPTNEPGNFVQCHLIERSLSLVAFTVEFLPQNKFTGSVYVAISDNLNCLPTGRGLIFKVTLNAIYFREVKQIRKSSVLKFFEKATRFSHRLFRKLSHKPQPTPSDNWKKLTPLEIEKKAFLEFKVEQTGVKKNLYVSVDRSKKLITGLPSDIESRVVTFASHKANVAFRNVTYKI